MLEKRKTGVDYLLLDLWYASENRIKAVKEYVNSKYAKEAERLFYVEMAK
jgi:hypothetical protein